MNEKLSFTELSPHLLYRFKNEAQMLKAIEKVGKFFNYYRENLDKYKHDEELISAYCAYWLTTNLPKLRKVLELLGDGFDLARFDRVVDVGTGPGTFLLALDSLASPGTELIGVDASPLMLKQAEKILNSLASNRKFLLGQALPAEQVSKTLLMFTHSLNEMPVESAIKYVLEAQAESILLIEPGTKEAFAKTLEFRDWCVEQGYSVAYPCFSNGQCPLNLEKDWCHQFVQVKHAQDVESMTQKLGRDRRLLPLTVQLYTKEPPQRARRSRLIRVYPPTKHSAQWMLCESREGVNRESVNKAFDVEVPKRGMSKKEVKELESLKAGKSVDFEIVKEMKEKIRVQLKR